VPLKKIVAGLDKAHAGARSKGDVLKIEEIPAGEARVAEASRINAAPPAQVIGFAPVSPPLWISTVARLMVAPWTLPSDDTTSKPPPSTVAPAALPPKRI
jgi:hypothetical protein